VLETTGGDDSGIRSVDEAWGLFAELCLFGTRDGSIGQYQRKEGSITR